MLHRSKRRNAALPLVSARPPRVLATAALALAMILTPLPAAAGEVHGGQPRQQAAAAVGQPTHDNPLLEPLKASAEVSIAMTGQDSRFDGTRALSLDDRAERLRGLRHGTVFIRFRSQGANAPGLLLGARKAGAALGSTPGKELDRVPDVASFFVKKDGGVVRYALPQVQAESPLGAGRDQWHMAAFSSTDAKAMRLTVDGREVFSTTNAAFDGLLSALTEINEVSVGGYREADGAVRHGFTGEISDVMVTSQAVSDEDAKTITLAGARSDGPGSARAELFDDSPDNTWAFTGGSDVAGGFSQTRGARNYVGQFEEYIRWDRAQSGNKLHARQRYTVNLARPGTVLSDVVADFDTRVAPLRPKATAYLISPDDYAAGEAGVPAFQGALRQFIDKAVAVRSGAFAVVQLPYRPKEKADLAERYAAAAKDVINEYAAKPAIHSRIIVVDHFSQTKADSAFASAGLRADSTLTAQGHLILGRQLADATIGLPTAFPGRGVTLDRKESPAPAAFRAEAPTASLRSGSLSVSIPQEVGGRWRVEARVILSDEDADLAPPKVGTTLSSATVDAGGTALLRGLPNAGRVEITTASTDGAQRLATLRGELASGSFSPAVVSPIDRLSGKLGQGRPLTWLFMGDSITHGALHTKGYDAVPQVAEKYVHEVLGRKDDVVVNTAVSGADTAETLAQIGPRLDNYPADVVSLMIGTNDSASAATPPETYRKNLRTIIERIRAKNPDAVIILRTPTPGSRSERVKPYVAIMKQLGAEDDGLIVVDQFTRWQESAERYPWLISDPADANKVDQILMGNNLHPGFNGQRYMARLFLSALGLWAPDNEQAALQYEPAISAAQAPAPGITTSAAASGTTATVDLQPFTRPQVGAIGDIAVTVSGKDEGWSVTRVVPAGQAEAVFESLPNASSYVATAVAYRTGSPVRVASGEASAQGQGDAPRPPQRPQPEATDHWVLQPDGTWGFQRADGSWATGWLNDRGTWYLLDGAGTMRTGWALDAGNWYYLGDNGAMVTGWQRDGDAWYYLGDSGAMVTGWLKHGPHWYYLGDSGAMVTGWLKHGPDWYYLGDDGVMVTGWRKLGPDWHRFSESGRWIG
ncbi:GDSL-type esterase/lipase family protein [Actinomyces marmotae]|nr:GDSL-type esterase/lipase family protein [Actinomyces marmotae]